MGAPARRQTPVRAASHPMSAAMMPLVPPTGFKRFQRYLRFASLGLELGVPVFVGAFAGLWLDRWLGTSPWLLLVGVLAGVAAAGLNLYRALRDLGALPSHKRRP
jgi:Putative F0F1-ATPase subunit Ca2+/Mg2+ transporter